MPEPNDPVIIAGAGPTGLTLACELALAGVPCRVLEQRSEPSWDSRALALHTRSLEVLDLRGLADRFVEEGLAISSFPMGMRDAVVDFRHLDSKYPLLLIIPQSRIEELLEERARKLGAQIVRDAKVIGLDQDDSGVSVHVSAGNQPAWPDGGGSDQEPDQEPDQKSDQEHGQGESAQWTERASYLVGCDGTRSTVRTAMGVPFPGTPNPGSVTLADLYLDELTDSRAIGELSMNGLMLAFPFGDGTHRVVLYDYARADAEVDEPVTIEEVRAGLHRIIGRDLGARDPWWSSRYRSEQRQVPSYRAGRVLLAGDAAHVHSPAGAQGLNTGLQDAINLGWKLAAELANRAPSGLLDSYNDERHPVGADVLRLTSRQFRINTARTLGKRLLRWLAYRVVLPLPPVQRWMARHYSGTAVSYPAPDGAHRWVGGRLPYTELTRPDGSRVGTYELCHDGRFVLVHRGEGPDSWPEHVRVEPVAGAARRGWPVAVLVRPDGYVAWASNDKDPNHRAEAMQEQLRRWCQRTDQRRF